MGAFGRLGRNRAEPRLDPVHWRRPGRGTLIRLVAVAALLVVAAAVSWSRPPGCTPPTATAHATATADAARSATGGDGDPQAPSGGAASSGTSTAGPNELLPSGAAGLLSPGAATGPSPDGVTDVSPVGSAGTSAAGATGSETSRGRTGSIGSAVPAGRLGVPIRLAEPTALSLIHPGDKVDLLRINDAGSGTTAVAVAALVLRVTGADDPTTGCLLLALKPAEAAKAAVTPGRGFAVLIRPG
jgi:hypothetical protein